MIIKWNVIFVWLFVASRRPFKVSKVWKTRYQNACNRDSAWGLFQYRRQVGMGIQFFYISWYINQQFWNTFITVREVPFQYYDLWNNKADIVISSFNNEWALLVHCWQRQAAVESSLRGDDRALDTPPAKPCARPSEAVRHFEVELWQDGYGGLYKAKRFPWCLGGTNISSI